jgi:HAD superfamily hydrolase (TIGR01509 family)
MTIPQAVVFDLGKVLLDFDYGIAVRNLSPFIPGGPAAARRALQETDLLAQYERGQISTSVFFGEVRKITRLSCDFATFEEHFCDIFTEIPAMIALHAAVRALGLPTYILSNTNDLQAQFIRRRFPFFSQFDGYVLSFEHGCMKPAPKLYDVVERLAQRRGAELIYMDDRPENVETARERGWQAIVHASPEVTQRTLRQAGLAV